MTRHAPRPAPPMTDQEWDEHVTWLMYEHGREDGYLAGFRAGYAASERDTADAWRPLAERVRRFAGQKTWDQIVASRAESERAAIAAAQQRAHTANRGAA